MRAQKRDHGHKVIGNTALSPVKVLAGYMQMCMPSEHLDSVVNQPPSGIQQIDRCSHNLMNSGQQKLRWRMQ
jgi:hypothetical protein